MSKISHSRPRAASNTRRVVLVTVSGQDAPGITSELTGVLASANVAILDIGQAVIHGLLSLSILFELAPDDQTKAPIKDLLFKAAELGLKLEFQVLDHALAESNHLNLKNNQYAVTLIADRISAVALHEVTKTLAKYQMNIDVIERLSEGAFSCVDMLVSSASPINSKNVKKELLSIAKINGVDIALQNEGLYRRAKRLVVLDMDSTLIQNEVIDEFARELGVFEEVSKITHQAMLGEMDYDQSLRLRCLKLKGLKLSQVDSVFNRLTLTNGASDLIKVLKTLGFKTALISGGFSLIADRLKTQLGIDYAYANQLEIIDQTLTGNVIPPIVNAQRKADLLDLIAQQERLSLDQVIAIGDGANDLLMLEKAGLGIAFNAKPLVREKADLALSQKNLRSILYLLGLSGRDLSEVLA